MNQYRHLACVYVKSNGFLGRAPQLKMYVLEDIPKKVLFPFQAFIVSISVDNVIHNADPEVQSQIAVKFICVISRS